MNKVINIQTNIIRRSWTARNGVWSGDRTRNPMRLAIRSAVRIIRLYR